jgi:hypothetical protein
MDYNDEKSWEESSIHSDISANTDIKVFRGGIRNGQTVTNTNKVFDLSSSDNNDVILKEYSPNKSKHKSNNNNNQSIKKNKINHNTYHYNINVKALNNKDSHNQNSLITTTPIEGDILSFRSDAEISVKQNINNENNSNNNCIATNDIRDKLLSKFKDFTQEDDEVINGYYYDKKDNNNKIHKSKCMLKSFKHIKIRFKVASIKKGVALLVSEDDTIFILPTFLLPKTTKIGNTYMLKIEETNLNFVFKNQISAIQKTYMKQFNE